MDLNSDLGEGYGRWALGDDAALLEVVTSANVACGFHAGDPATIDRTVRTAVERGVAVGAQVSYPDLVGFGRREIDVPPDELTADVLYQLGALEAFAKAAGSRVRYVKPHGALYNRIARDPVQAAAVVEAIRRYDPALPLLTLPGSVAMEAAGEAGIPSVGEGFADRAYTAEGRLVSRREPGAVLHDPEQVAARAVVMAIEHRVEAAGGEQVAVEVRSLCVHGDTPGAVDLARAVRTALEHAGVTLEAFA
ncbi:MAG: 5-oxoprolinase subunit PxpA [Actinomycetota bacterium]